MAVTDPDKNPYTYSKTRTPNLARYDRTNEYYLSLRLLRDTLGLTRAKFAVIIGLSP